MTEQTGLVAHSETGLSFGQTQLDPGDVIMPRIKLLQSQSEEVGSEQGKPGDWFNTLTSVNFGPELRFIPIVPFKQRVFLVREEKLPVINAVAAVAPLTADITFDKDNAGLSCRSYDMAQGRGVPGIECEQCPFSAWRDKEPPLCTETYNVAAVTEEGELIVLSLAKSGAREGKKLFSMIRMRPNAAVTVFSATSKTEQLKGKGTFQVPVIVPTSERAAPELLKDIARWRQELGAAGPIDITPDDDEPTGEGEGLPF